jgi:hypothetical protein
MIKGSAAFAARADAAAFRALFAEPETGAVPIPSLDISRPEKWSDGSVENVDHPNEQVFRSAIMARLRLTWGLAFEISNNPKTTHSSLADQGSKRKFDRHSECAGAQPGLMGAIGNEMDGAPSRRC